MSWRRYKYRPRHIDSNRSFNIGDFWALRRAKHAGTSVTIAIMCDETKLHRITFPDRGCIKLHNHHLRSEKAMLELSDEARFPRCVRILNTWKAINGSTSDQIYSALGSLQSKKLAPIISWRSSLGTWRSINKSFRDADRLDQGLCERLLSQMRNWSRDLEARIKLAYLNSFPNAAPVGKREEQGMAVSQKLQLSLRRKDKQIQIKASQIKQVKQVLSLAKPVKTAWILKKS